MIEILPIKLLTDEDAPIFGSISVNLGKLARLNFPVGNGVVVAAPNLKLKTLLEHFDFGSGDAYGSKEIFEQSLTLVKKEIFATAVPQVLEKEVKGAKKLYLNENIYASSKDLWKALLTIWIGEIKVRFWKDGFYPGITEGLAPQIIIFIKKVESIGSVYYDLFQEDTVFRVKSGELHPTDIKKLHELVSDANKKLFLPYEYAWIYDHGIKLVGLKQYTPRSVVSNAFLEPSSNPKITNHKSVVKVLLDLSTSFTIEQNIDGIYISSEKIFDLNKPNDSFENLVFKIVESAITFPQSPVFVKLADKSEGMGKVRGTLRLLHQKNLFDPILDALSFARHKKGLQNVHIVVPFVRGANELLQIKRELAVKKLMRKNSLQIWVEVCIPENIINLEDYLIAGVDGVVLNLDELVSFLNGFDGSAEEMTFYKKEVTGLLKFLEDGLKLLHKSKVPFIAYGSLSAYPQVLEYLVEKGVWGIVSEKYDAHSAKDLLYQTEKRIILRRS